MTGRAYVIACDGCSRWVITGDLTRTLESLGGSCECGGELEILLRVPGRAGPFDPPAARAWSEHAEGLLSPLAREAG